MSALFDGRVERWELDSRYHPYSGVEARFSVRFTTKEDADKFFDFVMANVQVSPIPPPPAPAP